MKAKTSKQWVTYSIFLFLALCSSIYFFKKNTGKVRVATSKLYSKEKSYFLPMKINGFSSANIPYFIVKIENQQVIAKIDLGYEGYIALSPQVIQELTAKTLIGRSSSYGLKGRIHESDMYELEKIQTETMLFYPVLADELHMECMRDGELGEGTATLKSDFGRIGWHLFKSFNVLVDHEHSILALCDSLETLKKQGYPVEVFSETPLLLDRGFLEFEALIGSTTLRCVLDTGSTWNMLNVESNGNCNDHIIFNPENFKQHSTINPENKDLLIFDPNQFHDITTFNIGGKEFGPITFNRIKSPLAIDAILGMEFFEDTLVFIDFSKHKLYFFEYPDRQKIYQDPSFERG